MEKEDAIKTFLDGQLKGVFASPIRINHLCRLAIHDSIVAKCESLRVDDTDCEIYYEFIGVLERAVSTFYRRIDRIKERAENEQT